MSDDYNLEVWQGGMMVASARGADFERVRSEAMHYAMVYAQDGPTEIRGIPIDKMEWLRAQRAMICLDDLREREDGGPSRASFR